MTTAIDYKNKWKKIALGEVVDFIDGDRGKNYPSQGEFFSTGYSLFLSTKNVPDTRFCFDEKLFIDKEKDSILRKGKLKRGDYVLTTRGTVGNFAYYDEGIPYENVRINSGMVVLRKKSDKLEQRYLRYFLASPLFSEQVKSRVSGAAQPQLPIRDMLSMKIDLPDVKTQSRIASLLAIYDDLIEMNEKRIKGLDEMANRLYTEWFVKFKFPGYKKVRNVNSGTEYGQIPEGWKVKALGEVMWVVRGRSYSSEQISDTEGEYYIVNLKSFNRGGGFRFYGKKYYSGPVNEDQYLRQGDVVVAVTDMTNDRAVIARPARVPRISSQRITFSADVVKMISEKVPGSFIYYCLLDRRFTEATKQKANGANVLHLKPAAILEHKSVIPPIDILNEFEKKCHGSFELIDALLQRNQCLAKMRDLLIPQFVTGKRELK